MLDEPSGDITLLLQRVSEGQREAIHDLLPLVYRELHVIAEAHLRRERDNHTLQPTELVNEAYLRLAGGEHPSFNDRRHFYRTAAIVMRHILVNHARDRGRQKRGGGVPTVPLDTGMAEFEKRAIDLVALDDALNRLAELDPRQADLVELRFFAGLTVAQTAEVLGVSPRTVQADWSLARAWLFRELA